MKEKIKTKNPFLLTGYLGEKYFCGRENETEQIISAIKNGRNLNLYNIRRIGKTALIQHSLDKLPGSYISIFLDIEKTETQNDLLKLLINTLTKKLDELDKNLLRKILQWLSKLGATVGIDEFTGLPKVDISIHNKIDEQTFEETFQLTQMIPDKQFVIAIDEFQQILNYPEKNTEAIFRTITQHFPNIRFIFCGSSRRLMEHMFSNAQAPFYQSTENVPLKYIDENDYLSFAKKHLKNCNDALILDLIRWCRAHTYYVQYVLNILFELSSSGAEVSARAIKTIALKRHEFYYYSVRKLVTNEQWKILKGIGKLAPVKQPTSFAFSKELGIAQSTIKYNLEQMVEKDLVLRESDGYKIYNVFLGHLLSITKL